MLVVEILRNIKETSGMNAKKEILLANSQNVVLKDVFKYGLDAFMPFHVVKVPKTTLRNVSSSSTEKYRFECFFSVADCCASRSITGNAAVNALAGIFSSCTAEEEFWMRRILKKHLSIGVSTKTVNKVFPGLISTFEVALAQKFDMKRISHLSEVAVEPKLDGIRCFAVVENGKAMLFARSGKLITNFDETIGKELVKLGPGCYDGELMGEDFTELMRQAYRKENVDTSKSYLALFDYLPIEEWKSSNAKMKCVERNEALLDMLTDSLVDLSLVQPVERQYVSADYDEIKKAHDEYVADGYEGAMIKDPYSPYKFGRGYEVMKMKEFHDVDLKIQDLLEGTGRHAGKLGSVKVVYNGVEVQVGSGFSDSLRETIWNNPDDFLGRIIEVRYQEETPDGSLRFPTFVCFRNDK